MKTDYPGARFCRVCSAELTSSRRRADGNHVARCPGGCGWWLVEPLHVDYSTGYFDGCQAGFGYDNSYASAVDARALHHLLRILPGMPPGPTIEIGAGNGNLAAALVEAGLTITPTDVSENAKVNATVKSMFRFESADVAAGAGVKGHYGIDVFEHLPDPIAYLLAWLAGPQEYLVLRTPNGLQIDWMGARSTALRQSFEHVFYPRPTLFRSTLKGVRLEIWFENHRYRLNSPVISRVLPRAGLAYDMWIVARK